MFRKLARVGAAVGLAAALIMISGTAALAAPSRYETTIRHTGGTIAVQTTGSIGWSSSLKTATISNARFYVRGGECGQIWIAGYQNTNKVTDPYFYPTDGSYYCPSVNTWIPIGTVNFTSKVAGGVDELLIEIQDREHKITATTNCYQAENETDC